MKTKLILSLIAAFLIFNNTGVFAEDVTPIIQKMDKLKESLMKYFIAAPKLNLKQKFLIHRVIKKHRDPIRQEGQELRAIIMKSKNDFRQCLTREQLLKLMAKRDKFNMRPPFLKISLFLKGLKPFERIQLLTLSRTLRKSNENNISQNIEAIIKFFDNVLLPKIIKELELADEQQMKLHNILDENQVEVKKMLNSIGLKFLKVKELIKPILSEKQINYIEANRDKVHQEILEYVTEL